MSDSKTAVVMSGLPEVHLSLFRRIQFSVHDPVVLIELEGGDKKVLILRDIEMERAKAKARVTDVHCPADFTPEGGLSGDRETATAQATAECLRQHGVELVYGDRLLPLAYVDRIRKAGIEVEFDPDLGVLERRHKTEEEVEWLREAQGVTEQAIEMVCRAIAQADARSDGVLESNGQVLTSESLRFEVDKFFLKQGYGGDPAIIAAGPSASDCHYLGYGEIKTGQPVIVDIFPKNRATQYCGDCTRTVVHGDIPDEVIRMHAAVQEAKQAGMNATCAGVGGQVVHEATISSLLANGYASGLPDADEPDSYCAMTHGTGHGIGLEVHEPPLLDYKGLELVSGDALTIEPGLYSKSIGGVRLEDMVIVREDGCENLNKLPEDLDWR
jgi:Xaa-Pro aminopeptidase